ncbi:MAG: hypothetical protein RIR00_1939 [Pseudomonadota bacterium]|jgi:DNA-binding NarL/FixJ family response regulator
MSDAPLLYFADPDRALCLAALEALKTDFEVRHFQDGMSCISLLSEKPPAILILSNSLADTPALDLCRDVRETVDRHDTHILLILSPETPPDFVEAALEAGCDEVLFKPVDLENLCRQLRTTYKLASERSSYRQQASYAQQVAMTAMTSMGELGVVLQFLSKCFGCQSPSEVAVELIASLGQYGLAGSVQLRVPNGAVTRSTNEDTIASDTEAMNKLHGVGRIFEFKSRMVINYEHASILLNQLPDSDEERGRIRDNVAMLAEGAHTRVLSLIVQEDNRRKQSGIRFALGEIIDMASELQNQQLLTTQAGQQAVNVVISRFEEAFVTLGLTASQEADLIGMLVDLRNEVKGIGLGADQVEKKLQRVVRSLQSIAEEKF